MFKLKRKIAQNADTDKAIDVLAAAVKEYEKIAKEFKYSELKGPDSLTTGDWEKSLPAQERLDLRAENKAYRENMRDITGRYAELDILMAERLEADESLLRLPTFVSVYHEFMTANPKGGEMLVPVTAKGDPKEIYKEWQTKYPLFFEHNIQRKVDILDLCVDRFVSELDKFRSVNSPLKLEAPVQNNDLHDQQKDEYLESFIERMRGISSQISTVRELMKLPAVKPASDDILYDPMYIDAA